MSSPEGLCRQEGSLPRSLAAEGGEEQGMRLRLSPSGAIQLGNLDTGLPVLSHGHTAVQVGEGR